MVQNKGVIFKAVPKGWPVPGEHLTLETREFDPDAAPPKGGITTKNYSVSFDPYQRGRMRAPEIESYSPPFEIGKPITNSGVAKVLKSDNDKLKEGDLVVGMMPTEEYSRIEAAVANNYFRKLDNPYHLDPKLYIGALGMPGLTAYSFYDIGKPEKGETILISAASGAVGQIVGQLAKHEGLTVIGSVGSDEKLEFIQKELGFDAGFNYKKEKPADALKRLAPKGINIYYENVGGEHLDAAIDAMTNYGRISNTSPPSPHTPHLPTSSPLSRNTNPCSSNRTVACGMISQYNNASASEVYGVKNMIMFIAKRLTMRGFIVADPDMGPKYAADHQKNVAKWISDGSFKVKQSVTKGIDHAIDGFLGMLKGENFGKAVLEIASLEDKVSGV